MDGSAGLLRIRRQSSGCGNQRKIPKVFFKGEAGAPGEMEEAVGMEAVGEEEMAHDEVFGAGVDAERVDSAAEVVPFDEVNEKTGEFPAAGGGGEGQAVDDAVGTGIEPGVIETIVGGIADGQQTVTQNMGVGVRSPVAVDQDAGIAGGDVGEDGGAVGVAVLPLPEAHGTLEGPGVIEYRHYAVDVG